MNEFLNYYQMAKLITGGDYVLLNCEDKSLAINQIINQKYQIASHVSNERAFLSLISLPMKKQLSKHVYQQIDTL